MGSEDDSDPAVSDIIDITTSLSLSSLDSTCHEDHPTHSDLGTPRHGQEDEKEEDHSDEDEKESNSLAEDEPQSPVLMAKDENSVLFNAPHEQQALEAVLLQELDTHKAKSGQHGSVKHFLQNVGAYVMGLDSFEQKMRTRYSNRALYILKPTNKIRRAAILLTESRWVACPVASCPLTCVL